MSESFEFLQRNVCMHRLDLALYSHLKEKGIESEHTLTSE